MMNMQKRVTLTSVQALPGPSNHGLRDNDVVPSSLQLKSKTTPTTSPSSTKKQSKEDKTSSKTIRIQIKLDPPSSDSCNEFSYHDLISKSDKNNNKNGTQDPFEEDDEDEVRRIARSFEEKYGGSKKKSAGSGKRSEWEDFVDKGMGYDETDPFIDNDEAYDELIPPDLTTKYGGFYVNTGKLEFKAVESSEDEDSQPEKRLPAAVVAANMKQAAKRRKSSENQSKDILKKKKKKSASNDTQGKPIIKITGSSDLVAKKKKPVIDDDEGDAPNTKSVVDAIESVVRASKSDSPMRDTKKFINLSDPAFMKNAQNTPRIQAQKQPTAPQMPPETRVEGLAMSSLARMASIVKNETKMNQSMQQQIQSQQSRQQQQQQSSKITGNRHPRPMITDPAPSTSHQPNNKNAHSSQTAQLFNRKQAEVLHQQMSASSTSQKHNQSTSKSKTPHLIVANQGTSGFYNKPSSQTAPQSIVDKVINEGLNKYTCAPNASVSLPRPPSSDTAKASHRTTSMFLQPPAAHTSSKGLSSNHQFVSFNEHVNASTPNSKVTTHRVLNLPLNKAMASPQEVNRNNTTPSPSHGQSQQRSSGSKERRTESSNRSPSSQVRGPPVGNSHSPLAESPLMSAFNAASPLFSSGIQSPTLPWSMDLGYATSLLAQSGLFNSTRTSPTSPSTTGQSNNSASFMARQLFLNHSQVHPQTPSTSTTSGKY